MTTEKDQLGENTSFEDNIVDSLVADLIGNREEIRQDGLCLRLASEAGKNGVETLITVGRRMPEIKEVPLSRMLRCHQLSDADSLIEFSKTIEMTTASTRSNGTRTLSEDPTIAGTGFVFISESGIQLVPDDLPEDGDREVISCLFETTDEFDAWRQAAKPEIFFVHRHLLPFLIRMQDTIEDSAILSSMQDASIRSQVANTSLVTRDEKSIGFHVKTEKGEELKKFPASFTVRLPVFTQDTTDESSWARFLVHLNIDLPDEPDGDVKFQLISGEIEAALRNRVVRESEKVIEQIGPGWTVLRGVPAWKKPDRMVVVSDSLGYDEGK